MTVAATASPLIDAARAWYDAGYCVIPSHEDGGKRPFGAWKQYQSQRPDWPTLEAWLASGRYNGIGLIMGAASGNAEMIEVEGPVDKVAERIEAIIDQARRLDEATVDLVRRVIYGCSETSAGGGLHTFVRVSDGPVPGNTKLAMDDAKVVAETRGEGGFVIVWPTTGRSGHAPGSVYLLLAGTEPAGTAEVTRAELDELHTLYGLALGGVPDDDIPAIKAGAVSAARPARGSGISPFDDYRQRVTWREILEAEGWIWSHRDETRDYWVRPGKNPRDGHSASTIIDDGPFYLYSSSVHGMPLEQGLSKGQVYAYFKHGGDLSAASRDLQGLGYGDSSWVELAAWTPSATIQQSFWEAHPTLGTIRAAAHSRLVSADAVLACALARVVQHIPYQFVLPPIVGGNAAPNMFVALIGESCTGKGAARRTADELLGSIHALHELNEGPLGSGEGLVQLFYGYPRPDNDDPDAKPGRNLEFLYRGVLVLDEEGSGLAELLKRQGQVTEQTLLKMWSGERLGFSYSIRGTGMRLTVPADEYRAAALLGIQPAAAAFLLSSEREGRGLPQRFLWASTVDHSIPLDDTPFPARLDWQPPRFAPHRLDANLIQVDPAIRDELRRERHARATGQAGMGLESHGGLVRLKAAAALAALLNPGEPLAVEMDTWALAGQLKDASDRVRNAVANRAEAERTQREEARVEAAVRQKVAVDQADSQVRNCARTIAKHIATRHVDATGHCSQSCAKKSLAGKYRHLFQAAIDKALDLEWIAVVDDETGDVPHYSVGLSRPS